jgi:PTH1 family peptidyl-tRNA hydrolase
MSKYLIAGLGNPGSDYLNNRHNIGFKVLDALIKASNTYFSPDKLADCATLKYKGHILVLIKPATFMNLSGKAVNYWLQHEKIPVENLLVVTDDIALPFGTLRLKGKGGDGGHNGLKSIQETLQTQSFTRLRFGVGSEFSKGGQADYVLGNWNNEENSHLETRTVIAGEIIKSFSCIGLGLTMTHFNNK